MKLGACQELSHAQNLNNWGTAGKSLNQVVSALASSLVSVMLGVVFGGLREALQPAPFD